jgi:hypothetical protein
MPEQQADMPDHSRSLDRPSGELADASPAAAMTSAGAQDIPGRGIHVQRSAAATTRAPSEPQPRTRPRMRSPRHRA